MRRGVWTGALLAGVVVSSCTADTTPAAEGQSTVDQALEQVPNGTESRGAAFDPNWVVDAGGYGPIRVGMSLKEVAQVLGGAVEVPQDTRGCETLTPRGWPEGVGLMIVDGSVARVDVGEGEVATAEGARIGSTEQEIHALYRGRVEVEPHKYVQRGHYLVMTPAGPAGAEHRIVFETDGERVTRYRAGALPAVEWVEGCA